MVLIKNIKTMTERFAKKCVEFIREDTQKKNETIVSEIQILGALFFLKIRKEGKSRCNNIVYSAAESLLEGYRKIEIN